MSELSEKDQERYARLAEWAESDAVFEGMENATVTPGEGDDAGRALLEAALGSEGTEKILGRPTLAQDRPAGESPVRHVRLSAELDAALRARADAEHRNPSEVVREALTAYLKAS